MVEKTVIFIPLKQLYEVTFDNLLYMGAKTFKT
jgi:hypothetical protein